MCLALRRMGENVVDTAIKKFWIEEERSLYFDRRIVLICQTFQIEYLMGIRSVEGSLFNAVNHVIMWKTLGKDAMYIELGSVWKQQVVDLASRRNNGAQFMGIMNRTDVKHLFNGSTEVHSFVLTIPKETTPEEIQMMADIILDIAKENVEKPFVSLNDRYQKSQVIVTNEDEPELIGMNRTEGYGSGKIFMPIFESLSRPGRVNDSSFE